METMENKNLLSDPQKVIVIKYLQLNPDMFEETDPIENDSAYSFVEEMVEELNELGRKRMHTDFWFNAIELWKESVRKDFVHAKKTRTIVSSFDDLQLLMLMKNELEAMEDMETTSVKAEKKVACRICMKQVNETDSFNLFTSFVENVSLGKILSICAKIFEPEEEDDLPNEICFHCSTLLRMSHSFMLLCEKSDRQLRSNKGAIQKTEPQSDDEDFGAQFDVGFQDFEDPVEHVKAEISDSIDSSEESSSGSSMESEIEEPEPMDTPAKKVKKKRAPRKKTSPEEKKEKTEKKKVSRKMGPQQCNDCGKVFANNSRLKSHRENVHQTEKIYSCEQCGKCFNTALKLSAHLASHKEDRPFVCETCGKGFKNRPCLRAHEQCHKTEKRFACEHCSFCTKLKMSLVIHMRRHTGERPFPCQYCDLTFVTYSNRTKHTRRIHLKLREHKCIHCGKEFFNKLYALKHTITHSGARPFYCTVGGCQAAYGWYANLRHHMSKKHPGQEAPKENFFLKDLESYLK